MNVDDRIISLANARPPTDRELKEFSPSSAHEAIAGALNEPSTAHSLAELAEKAGVSIRTLQRAISDPAALTWMVAQASRLTEARLGAVHARLYQMAMTSKSASWAKLYLERFDSEFKKQKVLEQGGAQQFNFLQQMDNDELLKWLRRMQRKLQGPAGSSLSFDDEEVRGVLGSEHEARGPFPNLNVGIADDRIDGAADSRDTQTP